MDVNEPDILLPGGVRRRTIGFDALDALLVPQ